MNLRPASEILNDLARPIPGEYLSKRQQGGQTLTYVAWHHAVEILDEKCPGWEWETKTITQVGNRLVMVGRLSIPTSDGWLHREATGQEVIEMNGYGDPSSNAESMAFRRAAAKFGLGLYLYRKPESTGNNQPVGKGQISRDEWLARKAQTAGASY